MTTDDKFRPTRKQLKNALKEIRQSLFQTGLYFEWAEAAKEPLGARFSKDTQFTAAVGNAVLDSTLMHLRALDDFLSTRKKRKVEDMKASDYGYPYDGSFLDASARETINKWHAHFSWVRTEPCTGHYVVKHNLAAVAAVVRFVEWLVSNFLRTNDDELELWQNDLRGLKRVERHLLAKYTPEPPNPTGERFS